MVSDVVGAYEEATEKRSNDAGPSNDGVNRQLHFLGN